MTGVNPLNVRPRLQLRSAWLLFAFALALVAAAIDDYKALVFISTAIFIIHIYLIYDLLIRKQSFRFFLISALSYGAWISLGVVQSGISSAALPDLDFGSLFQTTIQLTVSDYALSMAYLIFFIICCNELSRLSLVLNLETRFKNTIITPLRYGYSNISVILLFLLSLLLLIVSFSNLLSIRGLSAVHTSEPGVVPWWYPPLMVLISILPLLIAKVLGSVNSWYSPRLLVGVLGILTGFYYGSLFSRGALIEFIVTLFFSFVIIYDPPLELNKRLLSLIVLGVLLGAFILPHVQSIFTFINYIRQDRGTYTNPLTYLTAYLDFLRSPDIVQLAEQRSGANLVNRPLLLWPLAASMKLSFLGLNNGFILHQDIVNSVLNAVPRFLYPYKGDLVLQEALLYQYFPFSSVDTADSPALYSFASFWFFGVLVYPLMILSAYLVFVRFALFCYQMIPSILVSIISIAALATFAFDSYPEAGTSRIVRSMFLDPAALIGVSVFISVLVVKKKLSLRSSSHLA